MGRRKQVIGSGNGNGEDSFLNILEAAQLLNQHDSWIYRRTMKNGKESIPHYRFGGLLRFKKSELLEWAESKRV
jgi:excisionase family DNA binding protein